MVGLLNFFLDALIVSWFYCTKTYEHGKVDLNSLSYEEL